mmetsp:Transcript_24971/g.59361  ORF Transcript_24971/g.59361 Transcript_24971/m.59361 type:complete len:93 (+) Transcript_24971:299-577(+)
MIRMFCHLFLFSCQNRRRLKKEEKNAAGYASCLNIDAGRSPSFCPRPYNLSKSDRRSVYYGWVSHDDDDDDGLTIKCTTSMPKKTRPRVTSK